ncbi:MAG: hypothetical protein IKI61_02415 [Erysipelotrichaceae bacterium]|nr:hypothetical protein [Erysipelotrichaceae bacterium]MBQ1323493.1 hypothetical protein [Erysipelotrichaceae bacterium]MBQ1740994.1 hypothetical protein [Erysipelotrichaceae bacterium]MBQ1911777.1 hypothetical protein [Erysipelotrichaceae bacterium]MBQ2079451.1 hypothetical protein [Erysipelotrichaceae bacterium]
MSFRQYRLIDICFFIGMYALCEYLAIKAATVWFDEPYSISIMLPLLVIVMMRWDKYCIIPCIVYAILFVFYHRGSFAQYLIYLIGNLGFMLSLLYLNKVGKEKIRKTFYGSALFLIIGFLLMELSRGLASMLISGTNPYVIIEFILTDMLSLVFGILVIIIVRQVDGLFVDQKEYLLQINSQEEKIDGGWQDE